MPVTLDAGEGSVFEVHLCTSGNAGQGCDWKESGWPPHPRPRRTRSQNLHPRSRTPAPIAWDVQRNEYAIDATSGQLAVEECRYLGATDRVPDTNKHLGTTADQHSTRLHDHDAFFVTTYRWAPGSVLFLKDASWRADSRGQVFSAGEEES